MAKILIVDDESNMRYVLAMILSLNGDEISEASGVKDALRQVETTPFDLVLTDYRMDDGDGLDVLRACRETDATLPVVMLTAYATVEVAVEAMRLGAFDFITKPFVPETVRAMVRRAFERTELVRENSRLRGEVRRLGFAADLIGQSHAMQQVRERIARVAPTHATVLITGETGTGKELAARAIHRGSPRMHKPFIAVNCAAIPEGLLESELFGHEKGAFTGADRARQGLFEAAHGGSLFLDEAGEMSLPLQAKLLRVLTDSQIQRVGATVARTVDVRLIVATHRNLEQHVRAGLFREDLYYRLAVVPMPMPPLRERPTDIPELLAHFMCVVSSELKVAPRLIRPEAIDMLTRYPFPGNVREMRNLIERACILAMDEEIGLEDFPISGMMLEPEVEAPAVVGEGDPLEALAGQLPPNLDLRATLEGIEQALIRRALRSAAGVQAEAARQLNISRSDIAYKLRKYEPHEPVAPD